MSTDSMTPQEVKNLPPTRACLHGAGLTDEDINKPLIAVIYDQNNITPGHVHLDKLGKAIVAGISSAGGTGLTANAGIGICDGIAMGHQGMKYSLPSRELNRDCAISTVLGHGIFEGVVFIGACDKNIPGYLQATGSLKKMPGLFVTAGPMKPGCIGSEKLDVVSAFGARAKLSAGKIQKEEYDSIINACCPGVGSCAGLFTANSMACVTEALGLTLPGMATAHAEDDEKYDLAFKSGQQIMKLLERGITLEQILTPDAFYNAFIVDMAIGASTNTVLHVPAIAKELGYDFNLDRINEISAATPNLLRISPAGPAHMIDFHKAGGVPVVMKRLQSLLKNALLIDGTLEERLNTINDDGKTDIIRSLDNPYSKTGGIAVYRGNLAPEGAVIKESGIDPSVPKIFRGKALPFDSEESATKYINNGQVQKGTIIVIRYEGMVGGPGMREMLYPTAGISALNMDTYVALLTDGRFSGGTKGLCLGHIMPEAQNGGPIAYIEDGDEIEIDMVKKEINLCVPKSEIDKRKISWKKEYRNPATTPPLQRFRKEYSQ